MTLTFLPGEVNASLRGVAQARWKDFHVIAYGSGNGLILVAGGRPQIIYLPRDPSSIHIHPTLGWIAVAIDSTVYIYKPFNEYMKVPQWVEALALDAEGTVNSVFWSDDELAVGGSYLLVFHIYNEFGSLQYNRRFHKPQPNAILDLRINAASTRIVTYGLFDHLVKLWTRITYDDNDNSLFELTYLSHPPGLWLVNMYWRPDALHQHLNLDASMANIKNIRSYITEASDSDILYTLTNDHVLRVWVTYELSGHSHIKCWFTTDLAKYNPHAMVLVDLGCLDKTFHRFTQQTEVLVPINRFDVVVVFGEKTNVFAVTNVENAPGAIRFVQLNKEAIAYDAHTFPEFHPLEKPQFVEGTSYTPKYIPLRISAPVVVGDQISILVHDRVKNTIRANVFSFHKFLLGSGSLNMRLVNKFLGHTKSIRKLVTLSSPKPGNILLSISNFPQHNYIWDPLLLNPESRANMTISKRYQISVKEGIHDAVLINDIRTTKERHHLAITAELGGVVSFWNCNGKKYDDKPAALLHQVTVTRDGHAVTEAPLAVVCNGSGDEYHLILVYSLCVSAWHVQVTETNDDIGVDVREHAIEPPPSDIHLVSTIDSFITNNLLSLIDEEGHVRILSMKVGHPITWREVAHIHTGVRRASKIHGSSITNRFAVVDESGGVLTIWNTKSGLLEYKETFAEENGRVRDLDWTAVESGREVPSSAILSVGFARSVLLYTQLRYDYTNNVPTFAVLKKIDILDYTSHDIGDSIWIDNGYLVIGSGNQFFIDDKWVTLGSLPNSAIDYTIQQLMSGYHTKQKTFELGHLVRMLNGPLPVYHPQFLIQALFMNKIELVHRVLVRLFQTLRKEHEIEWDLGLALPEVLFEGEEKLDDVFSTFTDTLAQLLEKQLIKVSLPLLTRHQQVTLTSVVSIMRHLLSNTSLDDNGLRYVIGLHLFMSNSKQTLVSMRDINWGLHSDSRSSIIDLINHLYKDKVTWKAVKQTGMAYWVSERLKLVDLVELCARTEFSESRDPSGLISVLLLAIRRKQVLIGLWRTVSHKEKDKILKFLANDFGDPKYKTTALKNAFVLLGKHRYMDAAYFFLLADKVQDCCVTLAKRVGDLELALVVAKVYDETKATVQYLIENFVLPEALASGNRWATSWAFWELEYHEVSIQALIKSPEKVIEENRDKFRERITATENVDGRLFLQDDPMLILLFKVLRTRKNDYLKGSLHISEKDEFDFITKISSIYMRMGCDYLALLLVKEWEFLQVKDKKNDNMFEEFKPALTQPTVFEEPDIMALFDF